MSDSPSALAMCTLGGARSNSPSNGREGTFKQGQKEGPLDGPERADLLSFLVLLQLMGYANTDGWLRADRVVKAIRMWVASNSVECDLSWESWREWLPTLRLGSWSSCVLGTPWNSSSCQRSAARWLTGCTGCMRGVSAPRMLPYKPPITPTAIWVSDSTSRARLPEHMGERLTRGPRKIQCG